jgi:ankyrin repeat protein
VSSAVHIALIGAAVGRFEASAAPAWRPAPPPSRRPIVRRAAARVGVLLALALTALAAAAHETDQSTLPLGRQFADLRMPLSRTVRDAIVTAAEKTNAAIEASLRAGHPSAQAVQPHSAAQLQSADGIAAAVWTQMFAAFPTNEGLDIILADAPMRARYPGLVTAYRPEQFIYDDPLLLIDVTKVVRTVFRSSTINVDGTLFGTDKIIHFVHLGRIYHSGYLAARKRGAGEADAVGAAVQLSAGANLFLSENALLGMLMTGIRSNADLAANYSGFKFYRNLTESVRIGDRILPPMLVRDGPYWRVADRVRNQPDFFAAFITPHFNEVLNPNSYAVLTDGPIRHMLRARCPDLLAVYRDEYGRMRTREEFAHIAQELSTFYGEDYGYRDDGPKTVSVATTCFDPTPAQTAAGSSSTSSQATSAPRPSGSTGAGADRLGRTPLWWAARDGRRDDVQRLLAVGADPNAADIDGETPLHAAARWGHTEVITALLDRGADPSTSAAYGMTPLHVAVEESQPGAARALLDGGADVAARDMFGASPLHMAAARGHKLVASMLLAYGADPAAADDSALTPAQVAARAGNETLAKLLLSAAASPRAAPATGAAHPSGETAILRVSTGAGTRPADGGDGGDDAAAPARP